MVFAFGFYWCNVIVVIVYLFCCCCWTLCVHCVVCSVADVMFGIRRLWFHFEVKFCWILNKNMKAKGMTESNTHTNVDGERKKKLLKELEGIFAVEKCSFTPLKWEIFRREIKNKENKPNTEYISKSMHIHVCYEDERKCRKIFRSYCSNNRRCHSTYNTFRCERVRTMPQKKEKWIRKQNVWFFVWFNSYFVVTVFAFRILFFGNMCMCLRHEE